MLSMTYKREIELVFDVTAFRNHQPNSEIELSYIADTRDAHASPKTTEKDFFVHCIRDHVRAMSPSRTEVATLLNTISTAWDKAELVSSQISSVNVTFPTTVSRVSDSCIELRSSMLLVPLETRVEILVNLRGHSEPAGLQVTIEPEAKVVYGEHFNVAKVAEFLATRIGESIGECDEEWSDILVELHERLIARGSRK